MTVLEKRGGNGDERPNLRKAQMSINVLSARFGFHPEVGDGTSTVSESTVWDAANGCLRDEDLSNSEDIRGKRPF